MRSTLVLAVLAGVSVAVRTNLTGTVRRILGPPVMVAVSSLTTGKISLVVSPVLGAVVVGPIATVAA